MPAPVFYSVSPFGTGTIETGAGNITITSGVAVLTVEQTGNIGVGVDIEYNSLHCYIAPNRIGFDSGGTVELLPDTKIEDATSGATGIVRYVELLSGTWGGGDAAGWIYFESTTGTFGNNNIINRTKPTTSDNIATVDGTIEGNIGNGNTEFVVKSAVGADAANQTVTAVTSVHHEYASLSAFEAGFIDSDHLDDTDLTNADVVAHACCYYDHDDQTADTTAVNINFGTTDATRYLQVYTPVGDAESINSQRHEGKWDTQKWLLAVNDYCINNTEEYIRLIGLQLNTLGTVERSCVLAGTGCTDFRIQECLLIGTSGTHESNTGVRCNVGTVSIFNCCIYDIPRGIFAATTGSFNAFHCTVADTTIGITEHHSGTGTSTVKNCASFNNGDDFGADVDSIDYCASDDGDGTNEVDWDAGATDWALVFNAYATDDFTLNNYTGASKVIEEGTSLAASDGIWRDIAGNERGATPDIGAFEYVATGGSTLLPIKFNAVKRFSTIGVYRKVVSTVPDTKFLLIESTETTGVTLIIQGVSQSQNIGNIDLVQAYALIIDALSQNQSIDNIELLQQYTIVIDAINQLQSIDSLDLIQQHLLDIISILQSQSIDNIDLLQQYTLLIDTLNQLQSITNLDLVQQHLLNIAALTQLQTLIDLDLVQANTLNINDLLQSQIIDNLELIQQHLLDINNLSQSQNIDNIDLVQANILVIQEVSQLQSIGNIDLQTGLVLEISNIAQGQTLESLDLTQAHVLAVGNIIQSQSLGGITLSVETILEIANIAQSQNIDVINLTQHNVLTINGVEQLQSIDNITLNTSILLQIANIIQNQSIDDLSLSQQHILQINDLLQSQSIENVIIVFANGKVTITFVMSSPSVGASIKIPNIEESIKIPEISFELI